MKDTSPSHPPKRVITFLVVDDEAEMRRLLSEILEKMGRVDACQSSDEALQRVGKKDYDAIISDMNMPGMDGLEFYRRVRIADETVSRRFIFVTGGEYPEIERLASEGRVLFIKKPFRLSEMRNAVNQVLHQGR